MKICIVSQTFAPQEEGGAEISSRHAAQNLALRGHEVVVLALGQKGDPLAPIGECPIEAPYRLHRIVFHNFYLPGAKKPNVGRFKKVLWHAKSAWGAVKQSDLEAFLTLERFDLIYAQNASRMQPALFGASDRIGLPFCQHLRDYALLCPRTSMYYHGENLEVAPFWSRVLTARSRAASSAVTSAIAVSDFLRQKFLANGMFKNIKFDVLHNTNTADADFDARLRAERSAPETGFTFGYLGALSEEKGVEVMLAAFAALPLDLPARLIIAGRGQENYVARLKARVAHLPAERIEWLGHVKPEQVFARSEVIVMPSLWDEPLGRVPIEAAVYGVPTFAALSGGIPEIVFKHQIGLCYTPKDSDALSTLMRDAAFYGAKAWRRRLIELFPGLSNFQGTAEQTQFYDQLEKILADTVRQYLRK